jgi:hypothetical protein
MDYGGTVLGVVAVILLVLRLIGRAKYAVTFMLRVPQPRGKDLIITHQVHNIEAENPTEARRKGYETLSKKQKDQTTKVYMSRTDE